MNPLKQSLLMQSWCSERTETSVSTHTCLHVSRGGAARTGRERCGGQGSGAGCPEGGLAHREVLNQDLEHALCGGRAPGWSVEGTAGANAGGRLQSGPGRRRRSAALHRGREEQRRGTQHQEEEQNRPTCKERNRAETEDDCPGLVSKPDVPGDVAASPLGSK